MKSRNFDETQTLLQNALQRELKGFSLAGYIQKVADGDDLSVDDAVSAMKILMSGEARESEMRDLLVSLHKKGETVEEITSFAFTMRAYADSIAEIKKTGMSDFADTCGTGGKAQEGLTIETFNVSTASAFILAGAGVRVAKHGNRSITSGCGSADVLECFGVRIDMPLPKVFRCIQEVGIGFIFAPLVHRATRFVQPIRKTIPHPTIFNILGPLSNPFYPSYQLMGIYHPGLTEIIAGALRLLGARRALVVHGFNADLSGGMDEVSLCGPTRISQLTEGAGITTYEVTPGSLGLSAADPADLKGAGKEENARIIRDILSGRETGPRRHLLILNAAAALVACGKAADLAGGMQLAEHSVDSGSAQARLEALITFSSR